MAIDKDSLYLLQHWALQATAAKVAAEAALLKIKGLPAKVAALQARRRSGKTVFDSDFREAVAALQAEARTIPLSGDKLALGVYAATVHLQPFPALQEAREAAETDIGKAESSLSTCKFLFKAQGGTGGLAKASGFAEARETIATLCAVYEVKI